MKVNILTTHVAKNKPDSIWGGRFSEKPDALMERISASIDFDCRLAQEDIQGSRSHADMLCHQGIISSDDRDAIQQGLDEISIEITNGSFPFSRALEDIHMNIENRLKEKIGSASGRLHTARSRNDQVALDMRMWVKSQCEHAGNSIGRIIDALLTQADAGADMIMPGFTHLQTAQPITWGHHLMAYAEMFGRDRARFDDARTRMNECPLGVAALAGTSYPIDREMTAKTLGFDRPTANSIDTVSDRDFILEFLSCSSICAMHISRLAEEMVLWSSSQFKFIIFSEKFTTGSSIMPQKRNPDAAELLRAKIGRIIGALISLLTVMKGLPLAYSKDMQEDKESTFDAADTLETILTVAEALIRDMIPQPARLLECALADFSIATDFADWLVQSRHIPFRDAHHIVGALVKLAEKKGCRLDEIPLEDMICVDSRITKDVFSILSAESAVNRRNSYGGTAPDQVRRQVKLWRDKLKNDK